MQHGPSQQADGLLYTHFMAKADPPRADPPKADPPMKSSLEIAMEKLRRRDAERGEAATTLTARQKEEIAELRRFYKAKLAEREILHQADRRKVRSADDREAIAALEEAFRRDKTRLEAEMESKIGAVRRRGDAE